MNETEYRRNNAMVACIIAVILVGGIVIGVASLVGSSHFPGGIWNTSDAKTLFEFERVGEPIPDAITLDINVNVGDVNVIFEDNATLTYAISILVPNASLRDNGNPTVSWSSNTIAVGYPVCSINITLGTSATYQMFFTIDTGELTINLSDSAKVGNIEATMTTGSIKVLMSEDVSVQGDIVFTLTVATGSITMVIDLPSDVGGRFAGSTTTGTVDVTQLGWNELGSNTYETSNYNSAADTVTINASVDTGSVQATLS